MRREDSHGDVSSFEFRTLRHGMTQGAIFFRSNGILLITFGNWVLLIVGNWVLMMFLLIMEAAPMVIGGRGEVCECSNSRVFLVSFLGLVFCAFCEVIVEIFEVFVVLLILLVV